MERGLTKCVPEKVDRKLYSATLLVRLTMVTEAESVRLSSDLRWKRLSSPKDRSKRLREATRGGLWSGATSLYLIGIVCTPPCASDNGKYAEQGY